MGEELRNRCCRLERLSESEEWKPEAEERGMWSGPDWSGWKKAGKKGVVV